METQSTTNTTRKSRQIKNSPRKFKITLPNLGKIKAVRKIFDNKEIWKRIIATVFIIFIYRILLATPLPGINVTQFQQVFGDTSYSDTNYVFSLFTGGSFNSPSLVGMGIAAYINASIIIQLLSSVIPSLERLTKEGYRGREIINRYTRYLTLPLAVFYAIGYVVFLRSVDESTDIGKQLAQSGIKAIFANLTTAQIGIIVLTLTAGTMLLMWLGELITEIGIGNGMSLFISMNIATTLPAILKRDFSTLNIASAVTKFFQTGDTSLLTSTSFIYLYLLVFGIFLIFAAIVFITESTRKVPIQYARRVRGEGGENSSLPLKLNQAGVVPVIFSSSLLTMPQILIPLLANAAKGMADNAPLKDFLLSLNNSFILNHNSVQYVLLDVVLIILFSYFYSFVVMKPSDIAENLQKSGAFIPGIRPGKSTQDYITRTMIRLTFVGSIFLALIAVMPLLIGNTLVSDVGTRLALFSGIGGTSLIIIVGTALETYRQMRSIQISQSYSQYV